MVIVHGIVLGITTGDLYSSQLPGPLSHLECFPQIQMFHRWEHASEVALNRWVVDGECRAEAGGAQNVKRKCGQDA